MPTSWSKKILIEVVVPVAVLVAASYLLILTDVLKVRVFPYPHDVLLSGWQTLSASKVHQAIGMTLWRLGISFLIALAIGSSLALLAHHSEHLAQMLALPVDVIRSIPVVTLFPMFIALWGFTEATYLAVPVILSTVILYVHLTAGLRGISATRQVLMRRWGANRLQIAWHLLLPSIAPHFFTALRVSISLTLILVLVAEMSFGATRGIGTLIDDYSETLKYKEMYFYILLAGILGWTLNKTLEWLHARIVFWEGKEHGIRSRASS
jgi:ABC-type nitrate/sulfonate/bicarbonate transport system permease component